jgi:hypothetical protein
MCQYQDKGKEAKKILLDHSLYGCKFKIVQKLRMMHYLHEFASICWDELNIGSIYVIIRSAYFHVEVVLLL